MRMMEKFTGCRVLSYCLMCNHIHILLEVPPMAVDGISDAELLERLTVLYGEAFVADVAGQLESARTEGGLEGGIPGGLRKSRNGSPTGCMIWGSL